MSVKPRVAIASKSECLVRGAEVGFEVSNGGIVLAFCFGFSGVSVVVPVHVLKREGRLKPATTAHFF